MATACSTNARAALTVPTLLMLHRTKWSCYRCNTCMLHRHRQFQPHQNCGTDGLDLFSRQPTTCANMQWQALADVLRPSPMQMLLMLLRWLPLPSGELPLVPLQLLQQQLLRRDVVALHCSSMPQCLAAATEMLCWHPVLLRVLEPPLAGLVPRLS